ncbi:MAG: hypothetical protein Tsb002_24150 [Wenzhouxiangellaceae bacterium]
MNKKTREIEMERNFLTRSGSLLSDNSEGTAVYYWLDVLDNKTSTLISHVSLMMAVLAVFYGETSPGTTVRSLIIVELFLYLVIALGCLLVVFVIKPNDLHATPDDELSNSISVLIRRRKMYNVSMIATWTVTFFFMATLATKFFI